MSYSLTEKFTLVPKQMANQEYLTEIFKLDSGETTSSLELPQYDAILYFATTDSNQSPLVYVLLQHLDKINEHNKLAISYSKEKGIIFIAAAQGSRLLLAASYKAEDFTTAFYFIELATQQVMFNPHLTQVNILGEIEKENEVLLNNYYKSTCVL